MNDIVWFTTNDADNNEQHFYEYSWEKYFERL